MATTIVNPSGGDAAQQQNQQAQTPQPAPVTLAQPGETPEQTYSRLYGGAQTVTPPQATIPPEMVQAIQGMATELAALKSQRQAAVTPTDTANAPWVEKIRVGDFAGAEAVLTEQIAARLTPKIEEARSRAYQDALSASQVNNEMDRYLVEVRGKNPDLVHFERYLQAPVAERVDLAKRAGKIQSTGDFLREYRAAVDAEVATIRNASLQLRGAGKEEALVRNREVVSSQTLTPQQLQIQQAASDNQPQVESTDDYFARRKADEARRRGLLPS